jgi:hypothetical protein
VAAKEGAKPALGATPRPARPADETEPPAGVRIGACVGADNCARASAAGGEGRTAVGPLRDSSIGDSTICRACGTARVGVSLGGGGVGGGAADGSGVDAGADVAGGVSFACSVKAGACCGTELRRTTTRTRQTAANATPNRQGQDQRQTGFNGATGASGSNGVPKASARVSRQSAQLARWAKTEARSRSDSERSANADNRLASGWAADASVGGRASLDSAILGMFAIQPFVSYTLQLKNIHPPFSCTKRRLTSTVKSRISA